MVALPSTVSSAWKSVACPVTTPQVGSRRRMWTPLCLARLSSEEYTSPYARSCSRQLREIIEGGQAVQHDGLR
jgi:hypothetical protein